MAVAASEAANLLFQPLAVKGVTLKNRLVFPPCVTNFAAESGAITDKSRAYYAARGAGGAALVVVEASFVAPSGRAFRNAVGIHDDSMLPGLRGLAGAIHAGGALAGIQVWHAGRRASPAISGTECVAPSAIPGPDGHAPRALSVAEIAGLVESFAQAAARAQRAGFDTIEIHMAHSYLLNQFLSPLANRREDEYGGSLENRLRFPLAVAAAVRRAVGPGYPLIARISADEFVEGGLTLAETPEIARRVAEAGVDVISVSGGSGESTLMGPTGQKKGSAKTPPLYYAHLAAAVKRAVSVPVIGVGRLNNPVDAASLLADGGADLVAIGRGLLADPDWPRKVAEGRAADIRRCTCCNGCLRVLYLQEPIVCKQNQRLGQEYLPAATM